ILSHQDFLRLPIGEREDWRRKTSAGKTCSLPLLCQHGSPHPFLSKAAQHHRISAGGFRENEKSQKSHCP
ncbi:MAG TPA: hypothetical protein K8U76_15935, partial [Bilophila wadsworthia]|uniref:hypothetical protein n=1 Tax=Bilophila wadsworthia TaxID=35833 RepID=UPI001DBA651B